MTGSNSAGAACLRKSLERARGSKGELCLRTSRPRAGPPSLPGKHPKGKGGSGWMDGRGSPNIWPESLQGAAGQRGTSPVPEEPGCSASWAPRPELGSLDLQQDRRGACAASSPFQSLQLPPHLQAPLFFMLGAAGVTRDLQGRRWRPDAAPSSWGGDRGVPGTARGAQPWPGRQQQQAEVRAPKQALRWPTRPLSRPLSQPHGWAGPEHSTSSGGGDTISGPALDFYRWQ